MTMRVVLMLAALAYPALVGFANCKCYDMHFNYHEDKGCCEKKQPKPLDKKNECKCCMHETGDVQNHQPSPVPDFVVLTFAFHADEHPAPSLFILHSPFSIADSDDSPPIFITSHKLLI